MSSTTNVGTLAASLKLSTSGFDSGVKSAVSSLNGFSNTIKNISSVAGGVLVAGAIEGLVSNITNFANSTVSAVADAQQMEAALKSLVTTDLIKLSDGALSYADAGKQAAEQTDELTNYIRDLSILSPFSNETVSSAFRFNASMGQSIKTAKKTTEALLNLGAGLGLSQEEFTGLSRAIGQVGSTGKITQQDLFQLANNRFGLDKLNDVFARMTEVTGVAITNHEDFNKAVAAGKVTAEDFYDALSYYSTINYSGAVKELSQTFNGMQSTFKDISYWAKVDLFKPVGDSFARAFAPILEYLANMLGEGGFKAIGTKIANWFKPAIDIIAAFGTDLNSLGWTAALENLKINLLNLIPKDIGESLVNFKTSITNMLSELESSVKTQIAAIKKALNGDEEEEGFAKFGRIYKMEEGDPEKSGIAKTIDILTGAITAATPIISGFISVLGDVATRLAPIVKGIGDWAAIHPDLTGKILVTCAAIVILIPIITDLISVVNKVKLAFEILSGILSATGIALGTVLAPLLPIAAAIAAVIAVVALLKLAWDNNFLGMKDTIQSWVEKTNSAIESVKGYFGTLKDSYDKGGFALLFEKIGNDLNTLMFNIKIKMAEAVLKIVDSVVNAVSGWWDKIKGSVQEIWDNIVGYFKGIWDDLVGHSIVWDIIDDVVAAFTGWWDVIKTPVEAVKNGIIAVWNDIKTAVSGVWDWIQSLNPFAKKEETTELSTMVKIDPTVGVSQAVLDSYVALNTNIQNVNKSITALNLSLGNVSGLAFILSGLSLFISVDLTTTFTDFATLLSIDGVFGMALEAMNRMLSTAGGTTSTLEILTLINTFIAVDLTTTMTDWATFVGLGGVFGLALEDVNRRLSTEGSTTSLLQVLTAINDYILVTFQPTMAALADFWNGAFQFAANALIWTLWTSPNSLYNSLGAIQGVLEDIHRIMALVVSRIHDELIPAFKDIVEPAGIFEGACDSAANAANSVADAANAATAAINNLMAAMAALDGMSIPVNKNTNPIKTAATGAHLSVGETALIGEAGPELFTPHRSGWVIPNDELSGNSAGKSGKTINIEIHDIYGDANLENRIKSGVERGLKQAEFYGTV